MNKDLIRKKDALEFNNLMNLLICNDITSSQYDVIVDKITTKMRNDPSNFIAPNSLQFMNNIVNVHTGNINTIELFYPSIMSALLIYVENIKELDSYNESKTSLTEIVVSFANLTGLSIDLLGDICSYDAYFKKFLAYENKGAVPEEKPDRLYKEYVVEVAPDLFNW